MLPNFLHVGAAKCASSWLWRVCLEHPQIHVPQTPDNVNFFTVHYQRGLAWYDRTYFADCAGQPAVGEFSNSYYCHEPALARIARDLPDVKLTITIRQPVDRAFLSWAHIHLKKKPYGLNPAKGIAIPLEKALHHHGHAWFRLWLDPGYYAFHLQCVYRYFPQQRVRVMLYDDLRDDPAAFLAGFFEFLGVDAAFRPGILHQPVNPDAPGADPVAGLDPNVRAEMVDVFRDDIEQLQDMLGRDLSHWLK